MYYAPHILQVKRAVSLENDELGRPIPSQDASSWVDVCRCRCDDNTTKEFRSENGSVRGEGKAFITKSLNYLGYSEIWM